MISIESYLQVNSINILLDEDGIEEMTRFLNFIKKNDESIHLNIGNELQEIPITQEYKCIFHAKIIFVKKDDLPDNYALTKA